ncbi:fungal trichothecene efflux pump [Xylaria bambusicola]|uniref:fungal trichothecene efflux pump n=1 Tax=Xylaria bambusicola TaxID=326684 RepID=UPI002007D71D|nr:fungal trichothecene efflux pump [Xylaria bambusicola]KAI0509092.1 fungal trichothecene efflux pump [Xylaria bambusicola]
MAGEKDTIMTESHAPFDFDSSSRDSQRVRDDDAVSVRKEALGDDLPKGYFYSPRFLGALAGFCLSSISAYIFLLFPTNILTYINADIGPSPYISWVNIGRTLALSFTYTILGRLSDLFGRRWFFIIGNFVALIGIIVCSTAQNVNALIVGSTVYGIGETVQLSFNVAIGELVPNKYRPLVLSFIFGTSAPIAGIGSVISRAIYENPNLGWRWTYHLNTIVVAVAIVLLFFFYHPPTFDLLHERKTKRQILKQLDYVGTFLWIAGLTLFLIGISVGGTVYPWKSATTLSTIVIGGVLLIVLFIYETYADLEYPAIPVKFFRNRGFISLVACATVATMFYYSAVLLWPQQVKALFTSDITYGGWLSATVPSATAIGQVAGGFIVRGKQINVRYWIIFSTFAMVGFVGSLAALTPTSLNTGIALTLVGPFFVGIIELTALAIAPLFCKPEDIGLASGLLASIRSAGGSIAVTVYSTILSNRLKFTVPHAVGPAAISAGLPEDQVPSLAAAVLGGTLAKFPGLTPEISSAISAVIPNAYSQAYQTVYLASFGFGAIAILGCLFAKDARDLLTDKVERKMTGVKSAEKGNASDSI